MGVSTRCAQSDRWGARARRAYLGAGGVVRHGRGDEEDEVAAGDGWLEGVGVVHVRLEQPQPLRRAGERPEQPRLLLVRCTHVINAASSHALALSREEVSYGAARVLFGRVRTEAPQGGVDDAASAEELPDEPAPDVAAAAGDAHHRVRRAGAHPSSSSIPS